VKETGVDKKVKEAGDQLAGVIGRRQVNKLGEMTMSAFGYGDQETCICCPCMPASQVLLFLTVPLHLPHHLGRHWVSLVSGSASG